ncbi:MFS general substrate transporter [Dentipellis sp. KUC8613]|nr:MFS general substrate transporter [Dentipellis sp. KUC8613]
MAHSEPASHTSTIIEETPAFVEENKDEKNLPVKAIPLDDSKDPFLVQFDPNDPLDPKNWSVLFRWYMTAAGGILVLNATFASSAPSNAVPQMMAQFGMGIEVATLTISLFIAGYCVGPLFWGPLSEQVGRRPVFLVSFLFYTGFQVGCALSQNTASILIFRFLGGTFAAAPLTNSGGVVGDVWDAKTRGKAMVLFAVAPFAGPAVGPTVAGWIITAGVSWRWIYWVLTIFAGACLVMVIFTMPETYPPAILVAKAKKLRKDTGDDRYYAPLEAKNEPFVQRVNNIVGKPFKILFQEPMLLAITIYMSFLYGCLYLLFEAYPIVFTQGHHFDPGVSGLMFLPISIGGFAGVIFYLVTFEPRYERYVEEHAPNLVPPERRLEMTMVGAPLYAISFFWFGWTSYPSISFWSPLIAGGVMGFAIFCIFLSLFNYIIDTYLFVAASALAASTVVRSIFGAVFPLFARQMFDAMNPRWASTLLGCIALIMTPIPFVLRRYGPFLRSKSKHAPDIPRAVPKKDPEMA